MKELYLHIGQPKTGTSAIQTFLAMNREILKGKGIYYPVFDGDYALREKNNAMIGNASSLKSLSKPFEKLDKNYIKHVKKIIDYFKEYDIVLLSSETMWERENYLYSNIMSIIGPEMEFKIKVIVYLRRQDEHIESRWNQEVKSCSCTEACDEYARKWIDNYDYYNYYKKLNDISEVVGKENMIVRVYDSDKTCVGNGIYEDFMDIFSISNISGFRLPEFQVNPSLGKNMVEIKRILNMVPASMLLDDEYRSILRESVVFEKGTDAVKRNARFLTYSQRKEILEKVEADNVKVGQIYFGINKSPFSEPSCKEEAGICDQSNMYQDIIYFLGKLAIEQTKRINALECNFAKFEIPEKVVKDSRIIVYGADKSGRCLYHWLKQSKYYIVEGFVDNRSGRLQCIEPEVEPPYTIFQKEYDYIFIGVAEDITARSILEWLISSGVSADKIIRISQ